MPAARWAAGNWNLGASDTHEGEVVRGNEFDGAARVRQPRHRARRVHHADSSPGAIRKPSAQDFPTTAAATNSRKSATPKSATPTKPCSARACTHRVGDATFGAARWATSTATITSTRPASRRASAILSACRRAWSTPTSTRLLGHVHRHAEVLRPAVTLAYGVDWLREEGTSDGSLDFGGGFVLPTSFELTRTSWAPFAEVRLDIELRPVDAGRRARRQARRR